MEYGQIVFLRVLSCLFQNGTIGKERRNSMLSDWKKGMKEGNRTALVELLNELDAATTNNVWKQQLRDAAEFMAA